MLDLGPQLMWGQHRRRVDQRTRLEHRMGGHRAQHRHVLQPNLAGPHRVGEQGRRLEGSTHRGVLFRELHRGTSGLGHPRRIDRGGETPVLGFQTVEQSTDLGDPYPVVRIGRGRRDAGTRPQRHLQCCPHLVEHMFDRSPDHAPNASIPRKKSLCAESLPQRQNAIAPLGIVCLCPQLFDLRVRCEHAIQCVERELPFVHAYR